MRRNSRLLIFLFVLLFIGFPQMQVVQTTQIDQTKTFTPAIGANWLTGWDYRKNFTYTADADIGNYPLAIDVTVWYGSGTDAANNVYLDTYCRSDFGDVRFTMDDGDTELYYWLETYSAATSASFWVNITLPAAGIDYGYIYFGNAAATTTSNGSNVMNFFDDFETNDLNDKWEIIDDDWSITTTSAYVKYGSYAAYGDGGTGGAGRSLQQDTLIDETTWADGSFPLMVHAWMKFTSVAGDEYQSYARESNANVIYWSFIHEDDWCTYNTVDSYQNYATACFSTQTWYRLEVGMHFSNTQLTPYLNRVVQTTKTLYDSSKGAVVDVDKTILYTDPTVGRDIAIDDYYIRVWAGAVEPYFYGFGEREGEGASTTTGIDPDAQWALTSFTVLLGLVMIPASGLYLVKGGKDEMSGDKVFFFLIAFMIGWALFIGGIMP
jgi:hypothetical protein